MNDFLDLFEQFQDIHEIKGLIDDVRKLREHYYNHEYQKMYQHINQLTFKYCLETVAWNSINTIKPCDEHSAFINAEAFLKTKGFVILAKNRINIQNQLTDEELRIIESMIEPKNHF